MGARTKWVYDFEEGNAGMKTLLGGKGAGLAEMTRIGLPVPPGYTITTEACHAYQGGAALPDGLWEQALEAMTRLERKLSQKFGDTANPLLVSVRSGAAVSMPGMMDTVLNLGLNENTLKGLATQSGNDKFAYDSYRRFLVMFADIVLGIKKDRFEEILSHAKGKEKVDREIDLSAASLQQVCRQIKDLIQQETKQPFPEDPLKQLELAVIAVFNSWNNPRAATYRKQYKISQALGTAVNVQAMVYGNMGEDSASGVAFTRNPSTGDKHWMGEFLPNSQGEDVVAGIRTPQPIDGLKDTIPSAYKEFKRTCELLEKHYRDMQDIEFTIQKGKLYMLQTRTGKRTAHAALKIAVDMEREGLITKSDAVTRIQPQELEQLLHKQFDPKAKVDVIAKGLNASPGAASGQVVFDADDAESWRDQGKPVILVRIETNPEDIHGFFAAQGILTARGGMSSHAAVVARGMGKPCVSGCEEIKVDYAKKQFRVGGHVVKEGDTITIDGSTGRVVLGPVAMIEPEPTDEFRQLLTWADEYSRLYVRANADTPKNAKRAREFGAVGIGLCRTERMFNDVDRLPVVRQMILAKSTEEREKVLERLLPMQKSDFRGIFQAMDEFPVTIRLIDPPLHEFLPMKDELLVDVTRMKALNQTGPELEEKERFLEKVLELDEQNPMLGLRGCRLSLMYPEIIRMQARAIMEAACELTKEGVRVFPEIMVPLVGHPNELREVRKVVEAECQAVMGEFGIKVDYKVGTMMEIPRACLTADMVAEHADFFSFGTNDLTQTTFGYSRDDAEARFFQYYHEHGILKYNPFEILDRDGVGALVRMAVEKGRKTKPKLKIGICGEHGGEPSSIEFFHMAGLDYVSCSPFRVPIARLAAAHAALKEKGKTIVSATV
ncbi:MAG TPA: pyruvate, phosphate dikinase [Candidatus Thermoplasmatota archaeon]|nr:pyruvate, phosphate dikinase [Candidatus Thermoplasmatota archaeon]